MFGQPYALSFLYLFIGMFGSSALALLIQLLLGGWIPVQRLCVWTRVNELTVANHIHVFEHVSRGSASLCVLRHACRAYYELGS